MSRNRKCPTALLLTWTCVISLLLTACAHNTGGISKSAPNVIPRVEGTPMAPYDQQIYRFPLGITDISTLDPVLTTDIYSSRTIAMVFNGLIQLDDNLQVQPELAQSWEQSTDGLQWTFHLHSHLAFSDGTPLTSKDVAYSLDRALQPTTKSLCASNSLLKDSDKLSAGQIQTIIGDSILTPDAHTVVLKLMKKAAYFLYTLSTACHYIVEKSLISKYGNEKFTDHLTEGGGAGPFIVSQYLHKQQIDFVPNPYYYGFKPLLQKVIFPFIPTSDIAYRAYQIGELDYTSVPLDRFDEARQLINEYSLKPRLSISYARMNFLAKPFDNLHIRQAFALSIDRDTINNTLFKDTRTPTYHLIPQGMLGYNPNLTGPANVTDTRGDAPLARQLFQEGLREEGWPDISSMPPITFTYDTEPTSDKIVTALRQMWQSVLGVNVIPNPIEFNTLLTGVDQAKGNPNGLQMWYLSWSPHFPDPQDCLTVHFGKGQPYNDSNYGQNDTADALQQQQVQHQLEQADVEANPTTRLLLYQSAEQQIINQVGWIPLFQATLITLRKPHVKGVVITPISLTPPGDWAHIYIAAH